MMVESREIRLKNRPVGMPTADDFELATVELAKPDEGQIQVRNIWMSVDPYMRGRMSDAPNYVPPFALGVVMQGDAIGEVVSSNDPSLKPGDLVQSMYGWREAFNAPATKVRKLDTHGLPAEALLGVAGVPGLTAYVGLLHIAGLREGDIVFVSGAAGAVGSMACQIAKLKGHKVIATAGGAAKTAFLKNELGVDEVIDYKTVTDLTAALAKAVPDGIDVYFDNVGGEHLDAALANAKTFGRFALCGMISDYNAASQPNGSRNLFMAVTRSLRLQGFVILNHMNLQPAFARDLAAWHAAGKIKWRQTVLHGIEQAPNAFLGLFKGENTGKMLVKLG
ncbi:NADP-dependent oxidoreductase [Bradyrhizobium diazoefficiens]|nr:NADP-dependent oxidoreductase [Bradyrhizobium diazoefficiens]